MERLNDWLYEKFDILGVRFSWMQKGILFGVAWEHNEDYDLFAMCFGLFTIRIAFDKEGD
jgi:hypothetical protein